MKSYAEGILEINAILSSLILDTTERLRSEETYPQSNPDAMDDAIENYKKRIELLRSVRAQLEDSLF